MSTLQQCVLGRLLGKRDEYGAATPLLTIVPACHTRSLNEIPVVKDERSTISLN